MVRWDRDSPAAAVVSPAVPEDSPAEVRPTGALEVSVHRPKIVIKLRFSSKSGP